MAILVTNKAPHSVLLVCQVSAVIGIGHLTRMLVLADALQQVGIPNLQLLISGETISNRELDQAPHCFVPADADLCLEVRRQVRAFSPSVVVYDLCAQAFPDDLSDLFVLFSEQGVCQVGVDAVFPFCQNLDLVWIPTFYIDPARLSHCPNNTKYGWDSYLIRKRLPSQEWQPGSRVLVLTGGSDPTKLCEVLPSMLDANLSLDAEVHWVQGPLADSPAIPPVPRHKWVVYKAPEGLDNIMVSANYALSVFGVSFFELLQYGVPTVVFSPYGNKDIHELDALRCEGVAVVARSQASVVEELNKLMSDAGEASCYSHVAKSKLNINGAENLAKNILCLIS